MRIFKEICAAVVAAMVSFTAFGQYAPMSVNTSSLPYVLNYPVDFSAPGMYTNLSSALAAAGIPTQGQYSVNFGTNLTVGGNQVLTNASGGGSVTDFGSIGVVSNVITLPTLTANTSASFVPTNGLDVYNNVQSILIRGSNITPALVSPQLRIIANYRYVGYSSSNLFLVNGYAFTATTNYSSLSTNNFVCSYGTISPTVNSIVASNLLLSLQYTTNTTPTGTYPGSAFQGGVLLPDGRVFCVPCSSTTACIYNPATDTLTTPTGTYPGGGAFIGGVLLPDGRVFCVPYNSTTARIATPASTNVFPRAVLLGPTYNKL